MGRKLPLDNISLVHPLLYFSFLAAGFAATIAIITAICSVGFRRKSEPDPPQIDPLNVDTDLNSSSPPSNTLATGESISSEHENEKTEQKDKTETENNEAVIKELPLPPSMLLPKESISCNNMKRVTSERRSSFSMNLKMPRSLSLAKNWDQIKEDKLKGKAKTDDSVWMKTIILGEKCVPDDDEDPVIFEGKGKKISAYHPKSYSSMSMSVSRQNSFTDSDAVCASQRQEDKINNS